jgi:hypothetical protein
VTTPAATSGCAPPGRGHHYGWAHRRNPRNPC